MAHGPRPNGLEPDRLGAADLALAGLAGAERVALAMGWIAGASSALRGLRAAMSKMQSVWLRAVSSGCKL